MIRPERRGNAIVSFMKASVAKCNREQPDIIQAKPVGIEGGAVYMKHASQTGELILMSLRPWRDIERRKSRQIMSGNVPVGGDSHVTRTDERRVGKEGGSTCRTRGSPYH